MKRKLLAGFMAVCLILTLLPATALAADEGVTTAPDAGTGSTATYVAEVGGEKYTTLQAAINKAENGETVKLIADATEATIQIPKDQEIVLGLGGNTLTLTGGVAIQDVAYKNGIVAAFVNDGTLKIQNGTIKSTGDAHAIANRGTLTIAKNAAVTSSTGYVILNLGGDLTTSGNLTNTKGDGIGTCGGSVKVLGGTVQAKNQSASAATLVAFNRAYDNNSQGADVTISGGNFDSYYYAVSTNNLYSGGETPCNVTITGGTFTSYLSTIYWPSAGTVTVGNPDGTGPSLTSTHGSAMEVCSGTLQVQGGMLTGQGQTGATADWLVSGYRNNSGAGGAGDALTIIARRGSGYDSADLNVTVTGGTFNTKTEYAIRYMDCNLCSDKQIDQDVMVSVSGGEFNGGISAVDAYFVAAADQNFITGGDFSSDVSAYVAPNYECTDPDQDGIYTVSKMEDKLVVGGTVSGDKVIGTLEGTFGGSGTTVEDNTSSDITGSGAETTTNDVAIDLTTTATNTTFT